MKQFMSSKELRTRAQYMKAFSETAINSLLKLSLTVAAFLLMLVAAFSQKHESRYFNNLDANGVIIDGYDPVAFFTDNKPVKGDPTRPRQARSHNALEPIGAKLVNETGTILTSCPVNGGEQAPGRRVRSERAYCKDDTGDGGVNKSGYCFHGFVFLSSFFSGVSGPKFSKTLEFMPIIRRSR